MRIIHALQANIDQMNANANTLLLMVVGLLGLSGQSVALVVEREYELKLELVQSLHRNMGVIIV